MPQAVIIVKDVYFAFPGRNPLWRGVNLTLYPGQRIGVTGPMGAGKSTLFNLIMGLINPQRGSIYLNGQLCDKESLFKQQRTQIGYAFQDPDDQLFCATVQDDILFGPLNQGKSRSQANLICQQTLELFELTHLRDYMPHHLSGGEKRLVSLACIWALQPKAFLLDEPSAFLDPAALERLQWILQHTSQPWIMVSHDLLFLKSLCSDLWITDNGLLRSLP